MKKRIGTKLYDTEKGIPVIPELNLYKQPNKRTFYTFDGETITPVDFDKAAEMIRDTGDPDLLQYIQIKPSNRGCATLSVTLDRYYKLEKYAHRTGVSMKSLVESFIDSLPEA